MKQEALFGEMVDVAPTGRLYLNHDDSQDNLMRKLLTLYNQGRGIECDPMYGSGVIHKNIGEPTHKFDERPGLPGVQMADARRLPLSDESVSSVLLDPPFLSGDSKSGAMKERYTKCKSERDLRALYRGIIDEAYRILKPKGIVIFKCQDCISGGKKRWNTDKVRAYAEDAGFEVVDVGYLIRENPMSQEHRGPAQHLRSAVIQFIVLRKGRLSVSEMRERAKKAAGK